MRRSRDSRIATIGSRQHALITRSQLIACGVGGSTIDDWLHSGRLDRAHAGVYRLAGAVRTWRQDVLAACLAAGPSAIASGLTAARLWGIYERPDAPIEVTVPGSCHPAEAGFIVRRAVRFPARVYEIDGIPLTSPGCTLEAIARYLPHELVEEALDTSLRRSLIPDTELDLLAAHRVLGPMVHERRGDRGPAGSQRETRMRQVLRAAGLPLPVAQYEVRHDGRFVANVDFAYPDQKIAIEYDGYETHSSRRAFERDRKRWRNLHAAGFVVQPFTRDDLRRPVELTSALYRLLIDRGHPDLAR